MGPVESMKALDRARRAVGRMEVDGDVHEDVAGELLAHLALIEAALSEDLGRPAQAPLFD